MAELKTKANSASVIKFLKGVKDPKRRDDCFTILSVMKQITKSDPKMWGTSIVGFGSYHYTYASGREGDWPIAGFSPRAQNLTIYIMDGIDRHQDLMKKLGTYKTGKSCLYIKRLEDVDVRVLRTIVRNSVAAMKKRK